MQVLDLIPLEPDQHHMLPKNKFLQAVLNFFFMLPLFRKSTTLITCNRCGAQLTCRLACETLHNTTPSDIQLYPTTHWTWWMVAGILLTTLTLSVSWLFMKKIT